ncbi:P-loop containing nucleoside triphosphate hydrolase protein [Mycena metata]|uniref:P-loop containing nucleoside triphosphate hydrolase protein n=1 Tax=Mycena metata TaxID=1033252 RepID=A0AAD7H552_9AGAR|nr:P-loop containing nucleoside triphosphate hydrolase protein [Mycena metata]
MHNLQATVVTEQALQLQNIRASQIASHCPPPSRIFCGRQEILNKMHHFFSDPGIQHIYVLHGLGGAGKTQIALKFIKESSSRFSDIFFIDTSTIATIDAGLKNIAVLKDCGDSPQDGLLWLISKVEEWLLFFDNADDPNINLQDYIPQCNHGNIIITSRNPGMCVYAGSSSLVSDMEEEDAVALLLKSALQKATVRTEQIATEIVKSLHHLPLAIVQAGAFISKSRNLDGYLALYTKNQARLLSEKPAQSHDHYARMVYTTWQMSFDQLTPPAAMFLQHCSFLHYNGISEEIFSYASKYRFHSSRPSEGELQKPLEFLSHFLGPTGEWDSLRFLDTTNEVQSYSLISFDAEKKVFSIHPLVHSWSRGTVQNPKGYMFTMGSILGMAILERPQQDMQLTSLLLYSHVELAVQMNTNIAWVFKSQYAIIFWEGGRYKQAEKLQEEVLEEQKQVLGENHPVTLLSMGNLASSYQDLGEHQKAQKLEVIVLEKQKQILGENHPDTLHTMGNLANSYSNLGEHQVAKELQGIVLEKRKQILGENHPDTLHIMGALASSYSNLGEHQKAKELKVLVLEKQTQGLGENHPRTLRTMGNLANSYSDLGEYQEAKKLRVLVLENWKQVLGENHPDTLHTMGDLANSYLHLGEYQKAKELQGIVLEKRKQLLGENHPDTLLTMGNLASSYSHLGEHQKAKEIEVLVLEKQTQLLGENHPETLHTMGNLALLYSRLGEHQEAKELNVIVLEKRTQLLGENHPDTLLTMGNLANSYLNLGEHQKAKELKVIVLEKRKQVLGDNHPDTLEIENLLDST